MFERRDGVLRRVASGNMLMLLLMSILTLACSIEPVKATSGTIHIRADGSIEPSDAPITTYDNITYVLTDNISSEANGILVERDNIIIDGAGYTLQGTGAYDSKGIKLSGIANVTVWNTQVKNFDYGIWLGFSSNNSISENNIADNDYGIALSYSHNNNISRNNIIANCDYGVWFVLSSNNSMSGNRITNNGYGIQLYGEDTCNKIYRNKITDNNRGIGLFYARNNSISENNVTNNLLGISLEVSSVNNIIYENNIISNFAGISLSESSSNIICGNKVTMNNEHGVELYWLSSSNVSGNDIANNGKGIILSWASCCVVSENNIVNNNCGIWLDASDNVIYHNNIIGNNMQAHMEVPGYVNVWDDSYPSGGNYWSDYAGLDLYSGPFQNETGSDNIGDVSYIIDKNNLDNYPLMNLWSPEKPKGRGDVNGDGVVDISDIVLAAVSYGSTQGDSNWNPDADLASPYGKIDILDLVTITSHYGKTYP